jgi:methylated-DNA-[protein]-cysteine S-methyltransferase
MNWGDFSSFTKKVLVETSRIPYGQTRSYGEIAKRIGHLGASRAVGSALSKNPFPILIPCHRVVPQSGGIGGFRFGTHLKEKLLLLEGSYDSSK